MGKKIAVAVVVSVILAGIAVWLLKNGSEPAPSPEPEAPTEAVEAPPVEAPEPEPAAEPEPVEEVVVEEVTDVLEELPEPADLEGALIAMPEQVEPEITDPRCQEILDAIEEKFGFDKIETMRCAMEMEVGGMATVQCQMTSQKPNKTLNIMEISANGQDMTMYQVSDGVFMEMGMLGPDGTRSPMNLEKMTEAQAAAGSPFSGAMFSPENFTYTEAADYTADPADRMFQKADGAPIDNLNLTVLKAQSENQALDVFVDPESLEMVALRMYNKGEVLMELSGMTYEKVADGIIQPTKFTMRMNAGAMGAPGEDLVDMKMKMSDIVVNEPVDPATFHFTSNATQ